MRQQDSRSGADLPYFLNHLSLIEKAITGMNEKLEAEGKKALERQALLEPQGAKPEKSRKKKKRNRQVERRNEEKIRRNLQQE